MSKWEEKQLGSVCSEIFSGGTPSTLYPEYWNGEIPWLSSGETSRRYIYNTEKTITELGAQNSSTRLAKNGDIVIACAGQGKTRGQVSTIKRDMYINQSVIAIRGDSKNADTDFIYYNLLLRYDELRYLSDASSTRGSITTEMLKKLKIILPDLPTQQRIADILSAYDDLIENNNKRIALLQKAAQELYKEWFVRFRFPGHENTKFVNGLPEGWEVKRIKDIATVKSGYAFKSEWWQNDGVPVVKIKDIQNNTIDMSDFSYVSEEIANKAKHFFVTAGDLLIAMTGATIGKIALVPKSDKMTVNQRVGKFFLGKEPIKRVPFLFCLFLQNSIQEQIITIANSNAAQPNISPFDIEKLKIFYNTEIIARFNDVLTPSFQKIINLRAQNQNLAKQRDLLLPRLMSGKLEV